MEKYKMRVLFVSLNKPSSTGSGNQKVTILSAEYLLKAGVDCYLAYMYDMSECFSYSCFYDEIKIDYNDIDCFRNFLIINKIDIVHNQASRAINMKFLKNAVLGLNIKIISVLHNLPGSEIVRYNKDSLLFHIANRKKSMKWFVYILLFLTFPFTRFVVKMKSRIKYNIIYKYSDILVLLSDLYIPIYCDIANLKESSKVVSIPNFLSYDCEYSITEKVNEVLIVARFDEISKRILLALEVWKYLMSNYDVSDWSLTIVGYGEWNDTYEDFIKRNNLVNVKLVGRDESKEYYKRASVLMFTSLLEGAPLSLLEAMQMGVVPVAFNDCLAVNGLLCNDYNSKVVDAYNIQDYAKSIHDLIIDEKLRHELSFNAFNSVQYLSVERVMKKWINLYDGLLK